MTRYTRAAVFRTAIGDCTNGGITASEATIFIIDENGQALKREPDPRLVFQAQVVEGLMTLIPTFKPEGTVGPMFGGNLAMADRSSIVYRVHDRFETPKQYADLSQ